MPVELDESRAPILYVTYVGAIANRDIEQVVSAVNVWTKRGVAYAIVVDTLKSEPLSPEQRRMLSDGMKNPAHTGVIKGCATVIGSSLMRGILTALMWLASPKFPMEMTDSVAAAEQWARARLSGK